MLRRIQKILNIGKFESCIAPACEFKKETVIFGSNTKGKSTFTAIFRSLQTGNNHILIGRKTFGATAGKKIEFDFDDDGTDSKYIFQGKAWNKSYPNILIFDSKFIAENVFDGESITFDQQRNLNTVIIGQKGQDLNKEITTLQKQSDDFTNKKTDKSREFTRHFPKHDLANFRAISKDSDIESKIKEKDKEIKFEQEKEEIKNFVKAHISVLEGVKFSVREIFEKTLDVKQKEIETHIKAHFNKEEKAERFLSDGLDFLKKPLDGSGRVCVFCGQDLSQKSEELISIYSAFFKGGYEVLQKEIRIATDYFKELNVEAMLQKISADLKSKGLEIGITDAKIAQLVIAKRNFERELENKKDLNYAVNFSDFDLLKDGMEEVATTLKDLERKKLNVASTKTIPHLISEKNNLEIAKSRHEPIWVKFCTELDFIDAESDRVRKLRDEKRRELDAFSSSVFDTHKETINSVCAEMGADFAIEDFKPLRKIVGKDERIFAIQFFGTHKVTIDSNDEKIPNFRNTLSESDKRLLAFAFFTSLLMHDNELDKKVIIFDDPMSSFDVERRRKTLHHITDVSYTSKDAKGVETILSPAQKIILTHECNFAKELIRLMPRACSFKIEEYMVGSNKRSKLSRADFSEDFPDDDISQRIDRIKNVLDTRAFSTPFEEDCRVVLEHIFKRKYYLYLKTQIKDRKSVRKFTETLSHARVGGFDDAAKLQKFIRLCEDLSVELHDNSASSSNGDKESILKDFFDCLREI